MLKVVEVAWSVEGEAAVAAIAGEERREWGDTWDEAAD